MITYTDSSGLNPRSSPPYANGYVVHAFTASGTLNVPWAVNADMLVVGGGGGGGCVGSQGGGGGAGGVINSNGVAVASGNTTATIGAGGLGGKTGTGARNATSGGNSVFGGITVLGGGNGAGYQQAAGSGDGTVASGGGGAWDTNPRGVGTPGQGKNGGAGQMAANYGQGGGGGAGSDGQGGNPSYGGDGGDGLYFAAFSSWGDTNHPGYFGGGGGGSYRSGVTAGGAGGKGGGGRGGNGVGLAGQANTGGGGGGADYNNVTAGDGGSGIVIVRYPYAPGTLSVSVSSPTASQAFLLGSPISATATVQSGTGPFQVSFFADTAGGGMVQVGTTQSGSGPTFAQSLGSPPNGTYHVYASVTDSAGTPATATSATITFSADGTAPTLAGSAIVDDKSGGPVGRYTPVTYTVTFSEDMDASTVDAADFGNEGSSMITVGSITETSPGVFSVGVTPTSVGTLQLKISAGAVLTDAVGNALDTTSAIPDDTTLTVTAGGALTLTWSGTTDMVWTQPDSTSWNDTYYSGDSALFTGSGTGTVTISGTVTPLSVNVSAGNYTFSGGSLTTTGDIYVTSNGSLTLSSDVTVGNTRVFGLGTTTSASTSAMVVDSGVLNVGGGGGLTKNGTGTLTLTGTNTYTGNTTVNAGTLSITRASLADASTVTIANSAMLNLNFDQWGDVSDTVANLIIGTTQMAAGVYGATGSGATSIDDTHFSGVGTLTVTSGPYDTWANGTYSPALTAKLPTDNQDGDSLNNLQEFAFGTQPTVSTGEIAYAAGSLTTPGAPKVVAASGTYSMVFGRRADYVTAGLTYTVQFSADLDTWVDNDDGTNPPVQVATDGTINAMSVPFVALITTPSGSQKPTFSRVKVESTAPPPLPPPFPIESWTLSNDHTSITLAVTSDNKLVMNQLMDPTDGWNWTGNSTYLPMLTKAKVGSTTYNLKWVYNTATTDTSSGTKLTIKFTSQTPNIELWDEWWVRPGKGPVRHCAYVVNNSGSVLTVYKNDMFNMKVSGSGDSSKKLDMWYIHDDGSHPDATGVYKNTILDHTFTKQIDATVNQDYIPYVVLDKEGQRGIYFGAEWSTLRMNVSGVNFSGVTGANVKFGERNDGWSANVSSGSAFAYPPGFVGVYKGDIDDGGNSLRPYLFNYCIPASIRDDTTYPKVEWNAFAATGVSQGSWSSTETKYYPFIDDVAPLGFESVVLDVGWWGSTAPMEPNYLAGPLWPSGILAARNYANNKGMLFGLYQNEPENMSTEAGRNERIADWSYLHNAYGADFVRSDATGGGPVISGNDDYSATKGFYDVLDTLYSTVPGFQYENCNNGGSLKDFGIMKRMSNIFNTDYYTPLLVRQAFYDSSFAMHPMQLSGVVGSGSGQWSDGSVYDLRSSSMGAAYWFADGPNGGNGGPVWSAQHKTDIARFVTSYKTKIRPLVRNANLYHIFPRPTNTIWDGVEYYNPATEKGCVYIFRPESCSISTQSIILKGLDAMKNYVLSFEDGTNATVSKSGSELMSTGISVTLNSAKLSEIMWID